ncbi:LysR substrate-binding domain-containing protein [Pseudomonas sp. NA-150]|uniref:LysR substrate-binding domain-containing protein n=1 Tax=Pseudomonas sp. NA-150 TaxID=3367525 RepID=UPI0037C636D7
MALAKRTVPGFIQEASVSVLEARRVAFNPGQCRTVFRIGLCGDVEYALLPQLLRRLRLDAPGATLMVQRVDGEHLSGLLDSGEIGVGLSYQLPSTNASHSLPLRNLRLSVLRSDRVPGGIDLDQYCARPHAQVGYSSDVTAYIEDTLRAQGRKRRIEVSVPQFSTLPLLMANSDLIATVPDYVANAMTASGGFRSEPMPLSSPDLKLSMSWGTANQAAPAQQWLRSRIKMLLQDNDDN